MGAARGASAAQAAHVRPEDVRLGLLVGDVVAGRDGSGWGWGSEG